MKVTFCITCYDKDIHLLDRCLPFVRQQTVKPDEILVIASGIKQFQWGLAEDIGYSGCPNRLLPGGARNKGGKLAKGDIVVFCDVDDYIHPEKCRIVKSIFEENEEVHALVHDYCLSNEKYPDIPVFIRYEKVLEADPDPDPIPPGWFDIPRTNITIPIKEPESLRIHHGHISCKKEVFNDIQYREDMPLGEDGTFCREILKSKKYNLFYTPTKLITYN